MRGFRQSEFGMTGVLMTTTLPLGASRTSGVLGIDPGPGEAASRVPVASSEEYRPQVILKLQLSISFDYRVRFVLYVRNTVSNFIVPRLTCQTSSCFTLCPTVS